MYFNSSLKFDPENLKVGTFSSSLIPFKETHFQWFWSGSIDFCPKFLLLGKGYPQAYFGELTAFW